MAIIKWTTRSVSCTKYKAKIIQEQVRDEQRCVPDEKKNEEEKEEQVEELELKEDEEEDEEGSGRITKLLSVRFTV